ncbi:MAG: bifunctional hydroxymethylpyrimidine kinase/phosphomethylpyrimidine kinase [Chloroflexi bacterium]|nr:bifunctional hydroxymethylpyrimidine kinase/phosphomethylpyrimidine kinase [Chloroflexota bacterium]
MSSDFTPGKESLVIGPIGGYTGQFFMELAQRDGLVCERIAVNSELRTCLTIIDPSADYRLTELYEQGATLEAGAWESLVALTTHHLAKATFLAVCGSFPPGMPRRGLYDMVYSAMAANVPVLLDTYGSQLTEALEPSPTLLKINQFEAGEIVGQNLTTPAQAIAGAAELQKRGAQAVVVTLGKQGAVGLTAEGQPFGWAAPEVAAHFPTGSGDCLFAGIAASLVRGQPLPEAVRMGVAAGVANTMQIGAGRLDREQVQHIFQLIQPLALN